MNFTFFKERLFYRIPHAAASEPFTFSTDLSQNISRNVTFNIGFIEKIR